MSKLVSPNEIVQSGLCIGCGICVAQNDPAAVQMKFDPYGQLKPGGPKEWYVSKTEKFSKTCPFSPVAINENQLAEENFPLPEHRHIGLGHFQTAYVGHVNETDFREHGSSGGMVTWVATELFRKGLIDGVAHVVATEDPGQENRFFRYRIARTENEIRAGAKSRYYPIELSGIIRTIRATPGRYAIVGIPCFIKAINLLRREDPVLQERIRFTLGLFCGHMKSARFVESFAWQMNVPFREVRKVEYRHKNPNRPANLYTAMLTLQDGEAVKKDWWHLADGDWGAGFFMNAACNYCDDVVAETADISFGDAWVEPYSSDGKGTNVVVVRSRIVEQMVSDAIKEGRLNLDIVDGDFVANTQAAGFRQRREGLAYRLTWSKRGIKPLKRVAPDAKSPAMHRKLIYRFRHLISAWSHLIFRFARRFNRPKIYIAWARIAGAMYHGFAYHKGKVGEMINRYKTWK